MKPYIANFINSIVLLAIGAWGYISLIDTKDSSSNLIAPAFGLILLICTPFIKKENKSITYISLLLTFFLAVTLIVKFLVIQIEQRNIQEIVRISIMIITCIITISTFIKNFIDIKKARNS